MQYALLFYGGGVDALPEAERQAWFAEMNAWVEELQEAGVFRTSLRLADVDAATSLRRNGSDLLVTDGPFADTKETLGGLTLVECEDLDAALALARRCPIVKIGTVEVRPQFAPPSS